MDLDDIRNSVLLEYHLRHNHYPPVSREFFPWIARAIQLGRTDEQVTIEDGPLVKRLETPAGFPVSAAELIVQFHLDIFVDEEEEEHD